MSSTDRHLDHALAYPEPPASPLWHRHGGVQATEVIAVALVHPDALDAAAYLHGHQLGYTDRGWLRCETTTIFGAWQPAYAMLTHAAANLPLPETSPTRTCSTTWRRRVRALCTGRSGCTRPGRPDWRVCGDRLAPQLTVG
ncbi:hypothetical protein ACFV7Q_38045 [Streptomyces sp. NPDC059851]|uniref:hypothetical protein n=1 Tax=Streptomyces sp. NPDC059851 TaxID=3346971 RepID=UPI003659D925